MRFLIDQAVSPRLSRWLSEQGHQAQHVRERGLSSAPDEVIFALAAKEDAVIVTSDLDFSRILALSGRDSPGLILFRAGPRTDIEMQQLLESVLRRVPEADLRRSVVTVERAAIRIARLPIRPDLNQP
ncbi:MAG: DUF5615 family PIN-like protein [Phycisphaerae bacterium]